MVVIKNIEASVLARLKNKSKEEKIALQQLLNLFCQEEFIRRLSVSKYSEKLVLKGGFLLYAISDFTTRPTIDSDYLLKDHSNDIKSVEKMINEILSVETSNTFIELQLRNLESIREIKKYHGVRVNLMGIIGQTRTPFSIDFGVGDVVVPSSVVRTLPVLLPDFEKPEVLTYSLESTIAEKLDAIISLMEATSRMKDFYDIYYLATSFDFEGGKLQEAIYETLTNRDTPHEADSIEVIQRLASNQEVQRRWDNFCTKILKYELDFNHVVDVLISFISPAYNAIIQKEQLDKNWSYENQKYT